MENELFVGTFKSASGEIAETRVTNGILAARFPDIEEFVELNIQF